MSKETEATSPAPVIGDATAGKRSGNLSEAQATAILYANVEKNERKQDATPAAEETAPPVTPDETTPAPAAGAEAASVEAEPAPTETEGETQTEPEEQAAEDPVLSTSTSFTPEQQEILNKRVGKEIAKTKALREQYEARLAELEAKLKTAAPPQPQQAIQQQQAPMPVPLANSPLAHVNDLATLTQERDKALDAIEFVEATLENPRAWKVKTEPDPETGMDRETRYTMIGDKAYTEEDLRGSRRQAKATLDRHIPQRAQFIQARQNASTVARQEFPFLSDTTAPEYQEAQALLRDPWLSLRPDAEFIVGQIVEGNKAIRARRESAKKPAATSAPAKPKPVPVQSKPSSDQAAVSANRGAPRAPVEASARSAVVAERAKLEAKRGVSAADAIAHMQRLEQLRNSR